MYILYWIKFHGVKAQLNWAIQLSPSGPGFEAHISPLRWWA